jgi:hypothetical protein
MLVISSLVINKTAEPIDIISLQVYDLDDIRLRSERSRLPNKLKIGLNMFNTGLITALKNGGLNGGKTYGGV